MEGPAPTSPYSIHSVDFIQNMSACLAGNLFDADPPAFDTTIVHEASHFDRSFVSITATGRSENLLLIAESAKYRVPV